MIGSFWNRRARALVPLALFVLVGCRSYAPMSHKESIWSPDMAEVATAEIKDNIVTIHNMRHCEYRTSTEYDVQWYKKVVDLNKIRTVDFVMVPFSAAPGVGHTLLTFGFEGDDYVAISVETRRRKGETWDPIKGLENHFPLIYVVADERDAILRRAVFDLDDVYVYRAKATPEQARAMFVDMLNRANKLAIKPEFYNTLTNNCTTNIASHVNHVAKGVRVPYSLQVILPGYSDQLAYRLGLLATDKPFEAAKQAARVNEAAFVNRNDPNFSRLIRR